MKTSSAKRGGTGKPASNGNGRHPPRQHLDTALSWLEMGFSPLPPREDGSKAPLADIQVDGRWTWEPYQTQPATPEHIKGWYRAGRTGNGVATGFGGLELFEFDCRDIYEQFKQAAVALGIGELVERIEAGYLEETPGGGFHWFYVCEGSLPNTKLAERPIPGQPHKRDVLIETRGQGGFAVIAPSCGKVHRSGGEYRLLRGRPDTIATITSDEREALWSLAQSFDEVPGSKTKTKAASSEDLRPGDAYESEHSWEDILEPLGWTKVFSRGDVTYWRRPDKDKGVSATTGHCKGFYVFSTSTSFEPRRSYTKFGVYAHLHHKGDHGEAAKALAKAGFGTKLPARGLGTGEPGPNGPPKSAILMDDDDEIGPDVEDPLGLLDPKACHGPLGRLAQACLPQTEANLLFMLMHLLVFFCGAVGRGPHFVLGGSRQYLNLFVALVGISGRGRKQTAADVAREVFRKIDCAFVEDNITNGLNSGAGLLKDLRDPSTSKGKKGEPIVDEGVADKKRVYLQPELSAVLRQGHRESDPLLEYLRMFFDGYDRVGSKTVDGVNVTGAHVSLFSHCTPDDLREYMSDTDKTNGTANRFLWLFGGRSKRLPSGGDVFSLLDGGFLNKDLGMVRDALGFARQVKRIRRETSIEPWWEKEVYPRLDEIPPGKLGNLFVRATTIVMRMASGFALADLVKPVKGDTVHVRREHIEAALAIWEHSERSLRWIFQADVDPKAEKLLAALKGSMPEGLNKREICRGPCKGMSTEAVDELLKRLLAHQMIVLSPREPTGGRPAGRYRLKVW